MLTDLPCISTGQLPDLAWVQASVAEAHTRFAEQAEKHRALRRSIAARLHGEDADE